MSADERKEADDNNKAARVWISGLEVLSQKKNINAIIDLSATPHFLRGSGYPEGTLFQWTVYDFSLLDALECGIVKIPRLPVASDTIVYGDVPEFRNLREYVSGDLPKRLRRQAITIFRQSSCRPNWKRHCIPCMAITKNIFGSTNGRNKPTPP